MNLAFKRRRVINFIRFSSTGCTAHIALLSSFTYCFLTIIFATYMGAVQFNGAHIRITLVTQA